MTSLAMPALARPRASHAPRETCAQHRKASGGLSAAKERELAVRILAGDASARDELVLGNLRLARFFALKYARYSTHDLDLDDLQQTGAEGLVVAANRFDPGTHGTRFSTYAAYWIRQRLWVAVVNTGELVRIPSHVHLQRQAAGHRNRIRQHACRRADEAIMQGPLEDLLEDEDRDRLRRRVARLRPSDQELLFWYIAGPPYGPQSPSQKIQRSRVFAARKLLARLRAELNRQEGSTNV